MTYFDNKATSELSSTRCGIHPTGSYDMNLSEEGAVDIGVEF